MSDEIRILMVEDCEQDAELARHYLNKSGLRYVTQRVDTEAGLQLALRSFAPTIILSDFNLPTFDGLAALKTARALAPAIPFIFVSGNLGEEHAIDALHSGAVDYVLKSNLPRLAPAVRRALNETAVRMRQEAQIARLNRVLRLLSGVNAAVVRIRDRTELMRETCRLAVSLGGYTAVVACAKVPGNPLIQPVAWSGADESLAETVRDVCAQSLALADSIASRALKSGKTYVCNDAGELDVSETLKGLMIEAKLLSIVALPIVVDDTAVGILLLATRDAGVVGEQELGMLQEVRGNLSFALQYLQKDTTVRFLSHFDAHTGLAKRSLFCDRLTRLAAEWASRGSRGAVAMFDIESLGLINDSFGRRTGDLLLQHIAARLKRRFPKTESLAHIGGGTFALLAECGKQSSEESLAAVHKQIAEIFQEPFAIEQRDIPVVVRCAIALFPQDGREAETLVQRAEAALTHARSSGERQLHYDERHHSARIGRLALEHKLRLALERGEYELHYQPKVNVITRRIQGVEALIRWRDPDGGLVSPGAFLPVLETSGLAAEVGAWVIQQAAHDCHQWQHAGLPPVRVAVNLSPAQLQSSDFTARFLRAVQPWSNSVWGLDLEVTEGALHEECGEEVQKLKLLRRTGVKVAIDDFGTGYSSLRRLSSLPIDTLKIDGSFIKQIPADEAGKTVVKTIIALARAFKMTTVAEGVEKQEQLDFLWQIGCDQSQGFLHSTAIPRDEFANLLQYGNGNLILAAEPPAARSTEPVKA